MDTFFLNRMNIFHYIDEEIGKIRNPTNWLGPTLDFEPSYDGIYYSTTSLTASGSHVLGKYPAEMIGGIEVKVPFHENKIILRGYKDQKETLLKIKNGLINSGRFEEYLIEAWVRSE